jgi:hypothetical protein
MSSQASTNVGHFSLERNAKERVRSVLFQNLDICECDPQAPKNETTVSMAADDLNKIKLSRARQTLMPWTEPSLEWLFRPSRLVEDVVIS